MTHNGNITYNDLRNLLCPMKDEAIICYRENLYYHFSSTKAGIKEAEQVGEYCEQKRITFSLMQFLASINYFLFIFTNPNLK